MPYYQGDPEGLLFSPLETKEAMSSALHFCCEPASCTLETRSYAFSKWELIYFYEEHASTFLSC